MIREKATVHTESFKSLINKWSEILNNRTSDEGSQVFLLSCLRIIARVGSEDTGAQNGTQTTKGKTAQRK